MKSFLTFITLAALCSVFAFKPAPKKALFSLKKFEKKRAIVKPGLYASKFEATNLEYNEFLTYLEKKGAMSMLDKAKILDENWYHLQPSFGEPFLSTYAHHPAYENYPVVNISHEGAVFFCDWLTEQYNTYAKREFKKVLFRLPTEQEWLAAARAGKENAVFPWGGHYLRGTNGQFLANFTYIMESQQKKMREDGTMEINKPLFPHTETSQTRMNATCPVDLFTPNDFGIYNISGNAAEMLAEPGRTRGGSWHSFGYYLRLDAEDEYAGFTEPSPMIGFRYFMEVLEP